MIIMAAMQTHFENLFVHMLLCIMMLISVKFCWEAVSRRRRRAQTKALEARVRAYSLSRQQSPFEPTQCVHTYRDNLVTLCDAQKPDMKILIHVSYAFSGDLACKLAVIPPLSVMDAKYHIENKIGSAWYLQQLQVGGRFLNDSELLVESNTGKNVVPMTLVLSDNLVVPRPDCMCSPTQTEINGKMRETLVDWLVDVHGQYHTSPVVQLGLKPLQTRTLFAAISILDRYLFREHVSRPRFQLVGCAALYIAAKCVEEVPLSLRALSDYTAGAYNRSEIGAAEVAMLQVLEFRVGFSLTVADFLQQLSEIDVGRTRWHLASFLGELTLIDATMYRFPPSHIAAAAALLSRWLLGFNNWPESLATFTSYTEEDLSICAWNIHGLYCKSRLSENQALRRKYAKPERLCVSKIELKVLTGPL